MNELAHCRDAILILAAWFIHHLFYLPPFHLLQGSYGNTALHYACLFERTKHAELLLEYGAQPEARNEHGQRPLDLVPRDAVRSTKLYFKRIFDVSLVVFLLV